MSDLDCPTCGDSHLECEPSCAYCSRPAVIESTVGLEGDYSDDRRYIAPRAEHRCEECHESFVRVAKREQRLAEEGWV